MYSHGAVFVNLSLGRKVNNGQICPVHSDIRLLFCVPSDHLKAPLQCSLDYTEKYYLDYMENRAHSLGVRKTISVLSGRLSKLV